MKKLDLEKGAHINPYLKEAGLYNKYWFTEPQPWELFEKAVYELSPITDNREANYLDIVVYRNGLPAFVPNTPKYRKRFDQLMDENMRNDLEEFKKLSLEEKIYDIVGVLLSIKDDNAIKV